MREYFRENGEVAAHKGWVESTSKETWIPPKSLSLKSVGVRDPARMLSYGVTWPDDCIRKIVMGASWRQGDPTNQEDGWGLTMFLPENTQCSQPRRPYLMGWLDELYIKDHGRSSSKMAKSSSPGFVSREPSSELTCTHWCYNSSLIQQHQICPVIQGQDFALGIWSIKLTLPVLFSFFKDNFMYLFLSVLGLCCCERISLLTASSRCGAQASHFRGFSCYGAWL